MEEKSFHVFISLFCNLLTEAPIFMPWNLLSNQRLFVHHFAAFLEAKSNFWNLFFLKCTDKSTSGQEEQRSMSLLSYLLLLSPVSLSFFCCAAGSRFGKVRLDKIATLAYSGWIRAVDPLFFLPLSSQIIYSLQDAGLHSDDSLDSHHSLLLPLRGEYDMICLF